MSRTNVRTRLRMGLPARLFVRRLTSVTPGNLDVFIAHLFDVRAIQVHASGSRHPSKTSKAEVKEPRRYWPEAGKVIEDQLPTVHEKPAVEDGQLMLHEVPGTHHNARVLKDADVFIQSWPSVEVLLVRVSVRLNSVVTPLQTLFPPPL